MINKFRQSPKRKEQQNHPTTNELPDYPNEYSAFHGLANLLLKQIDEDYNLFLVRVNGVFGQSLMGFLKLFAFDHRIEI